MTKKGGFSTPARRRVFTAAFKLEMVRQFEVRRAQGVSQAQIARELDLSVPVRAALPRTLRVAEVDSDHCVDAQARVLRHLRALIPRQ